MLPSTKRRATVHTGWTLRQNPQGQQPQAFAPLALPAFGLRLNYYGLGGSPQKKVFWGIPFCSLEQQDF